MSIANESYHCCEAVATPFESTSYGGNSMYIYIYIYVPFDYIRGELLLVLLWLYCYAVGLGTYGPLGPGEDGSSPPVRANPPPAAAAMSVFVDFTSYLLNFP